MLVFVLLGLQILDTVLLFRLMRKGSFVTVENKVIYVPAKKKKVVAIKKPQPEEDEYDY